MPRGSNTPSACCGVFDFAIDRGLAHHSKMREEMHQMTEPFIKLPSLINTELKNKDAELESKDAELKVRKLKSSTCKR